MQTLRKKTSPLKYKNDTTRFLGDGQCFKAKLIGILEVSEARGDRMCQEALADLKMAIRAAGEHKQRITINIAIDGLRLRDEKTGDSLYHHPVHKISFIAQDMSDSRAFGYIFGSPDTGHRFFGIKTDKAASQVVIAMRDLFQVVFALKKKEIELAKQHLDKNRFLSSPLFSDSSHSSTKSPTPDLVMKLGTNETKSSSTNAEAKSSGTAVADLVDLELELSSLQQGLNQMERITPSDPFGSKDDPFGDSFTSFPKPILPPPPSGRERSSRTSDSSSIFSPKTPHLTSSLDTSTSVDTSLFSTTAKKDFKFSRDGSSSREESSSADWFTAGNSIFEEMPTAPEPTKDEKHEMTKREILSQFDVFTELDPLELKNPPKKALNDLVSQIQPATQLNDGTLFNANFSDGNKTGNFPGDPFSEDPFVTEDPFAETDFNKQDPFETEFNDFKPKDSNKFVYQTNLSTSPRPKYAPLAGISPKNTFDAHFEDKLINKLAGLHENPSLEISSESESAPEPPPRPDATLTQIKPPPLPPKKQAHDMLIKPPPRPPHNEEPHYDYMDHYETAPSSLEFAKTPPLPVPIRKSKFENDFTAPERPKKQFNLAQSSDEDYLTPISFPEQQKSQILLPPPQKHPKKTAQSMAQVTVASFLNAQPSVTSTTVDKLNSSLEGLDITLSQLTVSGLNELATKLNISPSELSNMTLVQLTAYLSNLIKSKSSAAVAPAETESFKADFDANFSSTNAAETYDRYAVFRELMKEEIKQTKIDTEPEELQEEKERQKETTEVSNFVNDFNITNANVKPINANKREDRYAALREIVESELKQSETIIIKPDDNKNESMETINENKTDSENVNKNDKVEETNIINVENSKLTSEEKPMKDELIEYSSTTLEVTKKPLGDTSPVKSPVKANLIKNPMPVAITEIVQNNSRLTSGSLSDVVSGSSPEVDNTASNSEVGKKTTDAAAESWAIFDQSNIPQESTKEKQTTQSEEGMSPWSSDSKEFGNGSPSDWRRGDSESGGDHWPRRGRRRDQDGWWDTSAEPEAPYCPSNRRSTDSYEEEYYECYERPRRRRQGNWSGHASGTGGHASGAGGHSSSSRDVSPWEEEPRRRDRDPREGRPPGWPGRHARQPPFDRRRERVSDSWDEEDDYEYEEEHGGRFHWSEHRDVERDRRGPRDHEGDSRGMGWSEDWADDRRHRRRREGDRDRWCCPDWEQPEHEKHPGRYGSGRWLNQDPSHPKWREPKHDERYYSRESQESPWEDEYINEPDDSHNPHYLSARKNWKRPSSASEMDRKTGDIKSRHHFAAGGSDGERDRRYKSGRRSRSKDSHYSEPAYRHKPEPVQTSSRGSHRPKPHPHSKPQFENEYSEIPLKKQLENLKLDHQNKKNATLNARKKKDSPKAAESSSTFPRKSRGKPTFEGDFEPEVATSRSVSKFSFEGEQETSEAESPTVNKSSKIIRHDFKESGASPRYQSKSLFEDDFAPCKEEGASAEDSSISVIKEEGDVGEENDSFGTSNFEPTRKKILNKNRLSGVMKCDLKKSDSVNIFSRESDPFDDDFFSENAGDVQQFNSPMEKKSSELRWTEDFEDYDIKERK